MASGSGLALNLRSWRGSVGPAPRLTGASAGPRQQPSAPGALGPTGCAVLGTRSAWKRQIRTKSGRKAQQTEVAEVKRSPPGGEDDEGSEGGSEANNQGEAGRASGEAEAFLSDDKALDAQILSLALPALIALCAEPVLSIIDTGFVGRLPTAALCLGGLGVSPDSALGDIAGAYLRIRAIALPASLVNTVAIGAFRGHLDTSTPLYVILLQTELQPLIIGSLSQLIRTLSLQAVLLQLTKTVVGLDTTGLAAAAHQVGLRVWFFALFALDSIAVAAQGLVPVAMASAGMDRARWMYANFLFEGDVERLMPHLERAMEVLPQVGEVGGMKTVLNGPTMWPADGNHLVGPAPEWDAAPNFWLACAERRPEMLMRAVHPNLSYGIAHSAGLSRYLSEYGAWATKDWVATKVRETYGMNNHVHFPNENLLAGRQGKVFVLQASQEVLKSKGCQFGFHNGRWESANYFDPDMRGEQHGNAKGSFRRPLYKERVPWVCVSRALRVSFTGELGWELHPATADVAPLLGLRRGCGAGGSMTHRFHEEDIRC
eukprot:Skav223060  [mRNA]  locus=scaffold1069:426018:443941:+ [translate_table: standard]